VGGPAANEEVAEGDVQMEAAGGPDAKKRVGGPAASGEVAEGDVQMEAGGGPDAKKSVGGPAASGEVAEGDVQMEAGGGPDAKRKLVLVVGLGNPGPEYENTYHNVGFRVVDRMADLYRVRIRQTCGPALVSDKIVLGKQTAVLVQPQTFMNRSGLILPKLFERFEAAITDVIVVYDEFALPLGKLRVRQKGSAGGHNGIKSIISTAGSDEFMRVRVGINPDHPVTDVRDFVLSRVSKTDRVLLDQTEEIAAKAVESLATDGIEKSMAAFNGIDLRKINNEKL